MLKNRHIRIPIEIKNNRNKNSYRIASKSKKNDVNSKNDLIWYKTTRFHQTVVKSHYC